MKVDLFGLPWWQPRLSPDPEGGGGEGEGAGGAEGEGAGAGAGAKEPPPDPANGSGEKPENGSGKEFKPITSQADFDRIFTSRFNRTKSTLAKELRAELEAEAEEKRQQESGQFQELATKRGTKISELERDLKAAQDRLTDYDEMAEKEYTEALATLPDAIKEFAPDESVDILTKRKWLVTKALPAAAKMTNGESKAKPPGLKPKDPPNKKDGILDLETIERNYEESGIYNRM